MQLSTRTFSLGLIVGCALLCLGTALANVVVDPQYVFRLGIVDAQPNPNARYQRLREYERDARKVDGLLFAASRGNAVDTTTMTKLAGLNSVASFAVPAGAMSDHLPFLQHVLRDKAAHGERIRTVLVLLDPDFFGTRPWTNLNLDSFMPPEISGEPTLRFWLRYLLAVQIKSWRENLAAAGWIAKPKTEPGPAQPQASVRIRLAARNDVADDATAMQTEKPEQRLARMSRSQKPFLEAQIADLERFVRLCRENGVKLTVAINPLTRANSSGYEPERLEETVARINQVTDVWDFTAPAWLADDLSHWMDQSHFKPEIADLMLRRMFSTAALPVEFGRFRPKTER